MVLLDATSFELALWWFFLVYLTSVIGTMAASRTRTANFYRRLNRPLWAPPSWLFSIWLILYGIMAYAAYRVRTYGPWVSGVNVVELSLFIVLLVFLALWNWLFFRWLTLLGALIDIIISWILMLVVCILFFIVDWVAGLLMIVPLVWLTFATVLMFYIYTINRGRSIPSCGLDSPCAPGNVRRIQTKVMTTRSRVGFGESQDFVDEEVECMCGQCQVDDDDNDDSVDADLEAYAASVSASVSGKSRSKQNSRNGRNVRNTRKARQFPASVHSAPKIEPASSSIDVEI